MLRQLESLQKYQLREMPDIGHDLPIFARGRLTLESGVPISITDSAAAVQIVYFTPYNLGCYEFDEISIDLTAEADDTNYDIFYEDHFLYSEAWAGANVRNVALAKYQGYWSLSTDLRKRYLGTVRKGTAELLDRIVYRYVWNNFNRVQRELYQQEKTNHAYNGAYRLWNNSTASNQLHFVVGLIEDYMIGSVEPLIRAGADASFAAVTAYLNGAQVRAFSVSNFNVQYIRAGMPYASLPALGQNLLNVYESGNHANSTFDSFEHQFIFIG